MTLGTHEEQATAFASELGDELRRLPEQTPGLLQIDDVDAVALAEDVSAHFGIPTPGLVSEVHTSLEQIPHPDLDQE